VTGGVRGFAELSLISSVQAGLIKLVHDMVHQTFLFIMVPDHTLLKTTTWNFIGFLFGNTMSLWLSLLIIIFPLIVFLKKHFTMDVSVPAGVTAGARRRIFIKSIRDERILKSLPLFLFVLIIFGAWFAQTGETTETLYNPSPKPLVASGGKAVIPLQGPAVDLRDGALHKFLLSINGEEVRLLVMKKSDGTLAVCLDACEICPPDGYGQGPGHVVCLYCKTPIPLDSLGTPGGCNPIPLRALVTDKDVQVEVSEIAEKWTKVKTGQTKETLSK